MVLSSQLYGEIVNHLRSGTPRAGSEKRRTTRVDINIQISMAILEKGAPAKQIAVLARDISIEGVGLLSGVALRKDQHVVVILPRNQSTSAFVLCTIISCTSVADGIFTVGCRFAKAIEGD